MNESVKSRLILFDIDGTLLDPGTLARELMDEVVTDVVGQSPELQVTDVAGFTDPVIIRTALTKLGRTDGEISAIVDDILHQYLQRLRKKYPEYEKPRLYDDAMPLVTACKSRGWCVGLLSGNIREAAEVKLKRFGIWKEFAFGVFGDDAVSRDDLLWVAREHAWDTLAQAYTYDRMVLVGDTPNDARIADENGVSSLIVCRRPEWKRKIEEHNPTWLVNSFDNVGKIIEWFEEE
ncbi:MAG: haloacid dehalogenase-like hydrolase [Candidatus Marinimicrobia bacterium]|jgi:phosphoglycolate phosphatase-like HAD superfamily hydrolase|nr:haloacid dehalogenase-like hydrolase [Candidatus Neomarinimicrobiota bacterium]MDP6592825.1 haloacid dehalogenase-like hydrolase [Candidatus Neomarinimicrobiota bacterium]MDP6835846.1 haloacid dehalogenase-like hydrolase [Candidatus Neomarinimicrobiota bacterium]MDP6965825.1 haloacid dehalogenase-like hydrolase [Candidatus Neomarinimicrobiota bacterium]|tara:strand:- start:348 stop:1052 length:705 start_codon:yes stop_codon:yes gene_type:complete